MIFPFNCQQKIATFTSFKVSHESDIIPTNECRCQSMTVDRSGVPRIIHYHIPESEMRSAGSDIMLYDVVRIGYPECSRSDVII